MFCLKGMKRNEKDKKMSCPCSEPGTKEKL